MTKAETYTILKNYFTDKPVNKVSVFGSFARGDDNEDSDIDLLIEFQQPVGLIALGNYIADLQDLTNRKIDLATKSAIRPEFINQITNDLETVYAK